MSTPAASPQDIAKRAVVQRVLNDFVTRDRMKLGIGSGSTMHVLMKQLADMLINNPKIHTAVVIPTSIETKHLLILLARKVARSTNNNSQLIVSDLDSHPILDVTFDGADEIDVATCSAIKGNGACCMQERLVATAAKQWIVVGDSSKKSQRLGTVHKKGVVVEVIPYGLGPVIHHLMQLGALEVHLKTAEPKKSGPVVTDSFNYVLSVSFPPQMLEATNVVSLDQRIRLITGVATTGLFVNIASHAYIGREDGQVEIYKAARPTSTTQSKL